MKRKLRLIPKAQAGIKTSFNDLGKTTSFSDKNFASFNFNPSGMQSNVTSGFGQTSNSNANNISNSGSFAIPKMGSLSTGFGGMGDAPKTFGGGNTGTGTTIGDSKKKPKKSRNDVDMNQVGGYAGIAAGLATSLLGPEVGPKDEFGIDTPGGNEIVRGGLEGFQQGMESGSWVTGVLMGMTGLVGASLNQGKTESKYTSKRAIAVADKKRDALKLGKAGMKLRTKDMMQKFDKSKKVIPIFKKGGAINVIPDGKLHKEKNELGNGDKGIPVVDGEGNKLFELEKEELILHLEATKEFETLVSAYNSSKDPEILVELGKKLSAELLTNTEDYSAKYGLEAVNEA